MSSSAERSNNEATDCHRVTWFAPERPVEGNTLYALDGPVETSRAIAWPTMSGHANSRSVVGAHTSQCRHGRAPDLDRPLVLMS